ncbi:MAG TPA: YihY/virulence factor BrkB family protein [Anaerolineae bacterium]|nr:YihY/virulence factor BrkB family protein [Anaerolineae bacterium]
MNKHSPWTRLKRLPKAIFDLLKETLIAWQRDKASRLAAALAYYALFSIAPLLIVVIGITGLVFGERAARDEIAHQIEGFVGPELAAVIQMMIANLNHTPSSIAASLIGLATILLGASGMFNHVQGALNTIWHAPPHSGRIVLKYLEQRLLHFGMVLGVGALLLLGLFADVVLAALIRTFGLSGGSQIRSSLFSLAMALLLFAVIYKVLPDVKIAWRDVLVGAVVTALLFTTGKVGIGLYMGRSGVGSAYGAAGSLVALMVWIYYSAQIFLLGAEFTHVYAQKFGSLAPPEAPEPPPPPVSIAPPVVAEVESAPTPPPDEVAEPPRRRPRAKGILAIMAAVAGTVAASVLGLVWLARPHPHPEHPPDREP